MSNVTLKTLFKVIYHKDYHIINSIKKNRENILIVGNGPSLSEIDLLKFTEKNIELCCVNSFAAENSDFFKLKPKYYCAIDPDYYREAPLDLEGNNKLFEQLQMVDWDMTFISRTSQRLPVDNPYIHYQYLPNTISEYVSNDYFLYSHSLCCFPLWNVINACLYYFITAKAKNILLIGIENDWHKELIVGKDNIVYRKKMHFYGEYLENVTATGFIKKGELYKYFDYYAMTLKSYYLASCYADLAGVKVTNLTVNSFVDCFDKVEPDDIASILSESK